MPVTVLVEDENLNVVAGPITTWTSLTCTLKNREVGTGQFVAPADADLMAAVTTPRNRVCVIRQRTPAATPTVFMSGPIEIPGAYRWSAGDSQDATKPGQVTVNFGCNLARLSKRITYPDPAHGSTAQTTDYYVATAANAETVLRDLVNLNAGPGAVSYRRVPQLVLGTVAGVGLNVTISTRFEVLTDVLRSVAVAGLAFGSSGLGFTIDEDMSAKQLVFNVSAPRDLSQQVRFSAQLGNLRSLETNPQAPTCTAAIVGGSGVGTSRLIVERTSGSAWDRVEKFINGAGGDNATTMQQAGDQALYDGAESVGLNAVAVDTPFARYGTDYVLNDLVSVELVPGLLVSDYVSAVTLTADPTKGEVVSPTIGTGSPILTPRTVVQVRQIERRLTRLEGS